ncbi:predicted membrane protein [Mycoplasma sp. CAG:776]|nr:predicted membrane protein [Mycoplasma sp. CAG:776]
MNSIGKTKNIINEHKSFVKYFMISVFVTVIDIFVSWLTEIWVPVIYANSIGIITGFIVQYFMTSKYVYNKKNMKVFLKFFVTFLIGFVLADLIVYIFRVMIFENSNKLIVFMISKGFSIVIPFFVMYFIRKKWIGQEK